MNKQDALGFTALDKSDSTDATSYTTKKQFNDGQLLKVDVADSNIANGYITKKYFDDNNVGADLTSYFDSTKTKQVIHDSVASKQNTISITQGNLLGRHTAGTGQPESVVVGTGLAISNDTLKVTSGATVNWGGIGGTLSSQTDLNSALAGKVDTIRTITINGISYSLAANRTWTIPVYDSLSTLLEKSYNSLNDKPTLGDLAALSSADTSKTQAKVISVNTKVGVVTLTTADIDTASNKKYVTLQEKNTWDGKVDKSDSTDATSYTTKKQFNDGQLLKVNLADSSGVNGYATQDDLGVKVNKADSTGVNGYATQDDLEKLTRIMEIKLIGDATATAATDSLIIVIPSQLNGYNLVDADAYVTTVSSSGTPTFTLTNVTDTQNMLSTNITIDANEFTSFTADAQPAINASYDDVATGDRIKIKCTVTGTGAKGSGVILVFQKP